MKIPLAKVCSFLCRVIETCKDYTIKALINTVDHLGSVAFKLNSYIDHTTCEVASMDLRAYSLDQRLKTCKEYIKQGGMYQNSVSFRTPNQYHRQYIIPAEADGTTRGRSSSSIEIDFHHYSSSAAAQDVEMKTSGNSPSSFLRREGYSKLTHPQVISRQTTLPFSWSSSNSNKSGESPKQYQLLRSGSLLVKRSMSPNYANVGKPQNPLPPRRMVSWSEQRRRDGGANEMNEQHPSKSKRLLKSLVSLKRSRKDGSVIYKHLEQI
ncbi:Protein ABIL2 [Linum grandiflorum]